MASRFVGNLRVGQYPVTAVRCLDQDQDDDEGGQGTGPHHCRVRGPALRCLREDTVNKTEEAERRLASDIKDATPAGRGFVVVVAVDGRRRRASARTVSDAEPA